MGTKNSLLTFTAVLLVTVTASTPASAVRRSSHYRHHKGHYRHIVWNPVLKGSYDSMLRQNEEIDRLQLPRIVDDAQLEELVRTQELVAISESQSLHVSRAVKPDKRYCRPWTNQCLEDMGEAYYMEFSVLLQVNSAFRTMDRQHKLRLH